MFICLVFFFFADPKNDPIRDSDPRNDPIRDFFDPLHPYIISNIFQTFHIVLEENYIAIIIVIELSPSPTGSLLQK